MKALALAFALILPAAPALAESAYDFTFEKLEGGELPLAAYQGKVLVVINTASFCGFTDQYKGMVKLWDGYKDKGVVVIGVPSDDFDQEPGSNAEIKQFCELTYGVDFPMAGKTHVVGPDAHPFYKWAATSFGTDDVPSWNFHKYLIGQDGQIVDAYSAFTGPSGLSDAIDRLLAAPKS